LEVIQPNIQYNCDFELPDSRETFYGTLILKNREVVGEFFNLPDALQVETDDPFDIDIITKIPLVFCKFKNEQGKLIKATLVDYRITSFNIGDIVRGSFYTHLVAFGEFITDPKSELYSAINVFPRDLSYWVFISNLKQTGNGGFQVEHDKFKPEIFHESSDKKVSLRTSSNWKGTRHSIDLKQFFYIHVEFNRDVGFSELLKQAEEIRCLFSLLFVDTVPLDYFTTKGKNKQIAWIRSDNRIYTSKRFNYTFAIPFNYTEFENFRVVIDNWFKKDDYLNLLSIKYFETTSIFM